MCHGTSGSELAIDTVPELGRDAAGTIGRLGSTDLTAPSGTVHGNREE